jgi:hypothetical protein
VPWLPLRPLFDAFADIRGVGFSKMTKALHRKRQGAVTGSLRILDLLIWSVEAAA